MRALFTQFSGLLGILAFVNRMLGGAAIEKSLLVAVGTGLAVYAVLTIGDLVIQRIVQLAPAGLAQAPADPEPAPEANSSAPPPEAKAA